MFAPNALYGRFTDYADSMTRSRISKLTTTSVSTQCHGASATVKTMTMTTTTMMMMRTMNKVRTV